MQFLFVDESGDAKFDGYFGLCVAAINSAHYKTAKAGFHAILRQHGWKESIEFKGSHLFSATKGDPHISIDQRIEIAGAVLDLNKSERNARMRFHYGSRTDCEEQKAAYLATLPKLICKALPKIHKKNGKDLVMVSCDERSDTSAAEIQAVILPAIASRGYTLIEEVTTARSSFHTVGILYADLVSYLSARIETISTDAELFDGVAPELLEQNGKVKKLRSSTDLISRVKRLDRHVLD